MRKDHQKAENLRRSGKSYKEISEVLGIPTATLSGWFKNLGWSIEIRNRLRAKASFSYPEKLKLMVTATKKKWTDWHKECQQKAIEEFPALKTASLFTAGLMLYWGEGDKILENGKVRLSSSDPKIIKTFYYFLKLLKVSDDKIYVNLILYPDLIDLVQKNLWSKSIGIPISKFKKSVYIQRKHKTKKSAGVCMIGLNSRELKEKILKWIELYHNDLINQSANFV